MQKLRKCLAAVLVAVMMLSLGSGMVNTEAQAAGETGKITISHAEQGKTYKAYRIFDLSKGTSPDKFSYRVTADWKQNWEIFFTDGGYLVGTNEKNNLNAVVVDGQEKYLNIIEKNKVEFAKKAYDHVIKQNIQGALTSTPGGDGTTAEISNMPYGYYLVFEDGTKDVIPTVITVDGAETMSPKGTVPTIEKEVVKPTTDIGGVVTYKIKGTVPNVKAYTEYHYIVRDSMTNLVLTDEYEVKINGVTVPQENIRPVGNEKLPTPGENSFAMDIDMTKYSGQIGSPVEITYTAKLTKDAVKGDQGNPNKASLEYSNDPKDPNSYGKNPDVVVKVHTFDLSIKKVDKAHPNTTLDGAEFVLYKNDPKNGKLYYYQDTATKEVSWKSIGDKKPVDAANDKTISKVTTVGGVATFEGIAEGTYYLEEIKAPDGYNILTGPQEVNITSNDQNVTWENPVVVVENSTGTELPGTGGIGNTIFYIVGGALILAGVVLLMRKRAK